MSNPVIPQDLAIEQLRSGGYRDAAHALAELIDNSIQAGAARVQLLCGESLNGRGMRIAEVGVLDDGSGMNAETLQIALQFGNGTRKSARKGMGKFGMGLPMASISQVKRVEVYSWQEGGAPLYSYIDVDEIAQGAMKEVPAPEERKVPDVWKKAAQELGNSGTLVIWKNPDRLKWVRGSTIVRHSDFIVGRMYRHMLNPGADSPTRIEFKVFDLKAPGKFKERVVVENDPLMLVPYSNLKGKWSEIPVCEVFKTLTLPFQHPNGVCSEVSVRFSMAKEEARHDPEDLQPQGTRPHGKHAQKHMGVSVVRAGRELEMLTDFVTDSYLDRWWGVEISFDPDMDEVFGVTNNKQSATGLAEVAHSVLKAQDIEVAEMKQVAEEDGDLERLFLIDLVRKVASTKSAMYRHIKAQGQSASHAKKSARHKDAQVKASAVAKARNKQGIPTLSGRSGEGLTSEDKQKQIREELEKGGHTEDATKSILESYFSEGLEVEFVPEEVDSPVLFSPVPKAGKMLVKINTRHPGYSTLVAAVDDEVDDLSAEELKSRLNQASVGLRLLFASWARMEDEMTDDDERDQVAQIRQTWGTYARAFLK